jgi:hypothetical protein
MKLAAHLLCLPLCFILLNVAGIYGWLAGCEWMQWPEPLGIFIVIPFLAYFFVPSAGGIIYLALCQVSLGAVWLKVRPSGKTRIVFLGYNAVILIFIGYDAWWYATGQTTHMGMGYL